MTKNKLKTNRAAAKRFKINKNKKIKRKKAFLRHNLSKRTKAVKMSLRQTGYVSKSDTKRVLELLPYG